MIFEGKSIRVELLEQGIVELCFDAREPINKLDSNTEFWCCCVFPVEESFFVGI